MLPRLEVVGLAERRPSVLLGDEVTLYHSDKDNEHGFIGFVHELHENNISLKLHPTFDASFQYDVEFSMSRISFRRMHQALSLDHGLDHLLHPGPVDVFRTNRPIRASTPFDQNMLENAPQQAAVSSILDLPENSPPYIIFGPYVTNLFSYELSVHPDIAAFLVLGQALGRHLWLWKPSVKS